MEVFQKTAWAGTTDLTEQACMNRVKELRGISIVRIKIDSKLIRNLNTGNTTFMVLFSLYD